MRRATGVVAGAAVLAAVASVLIATDGARRAQAPEVWGVVVDEAGAPVPGASVQSPSGADAVTGADGSFSLGLGEPGLLRFSAAGHLGRVQAATPDHGMRVTLSGDASTLSLRFGGDVMAGRRFFESSGDAPALLSPGADGPAHAALLDAVAPLLADSDVTVVNLETALMEDPVVPAVGRDPRFHPTKELVIASSPALADGLALAGVDVAVLGNNHVYDGLEAGLVSTLAALDRAGVAHVGAGLTVEDAWAPAYVERRGKRVAFVSCTTVSGDQHEVTYVASATQGGAARCTAERLRATVAEAAGRADSVVALLHGDVEYVRTQVPLVTELARVASGAGAGAVVISHPHVIGGVTSIGSTVVAETMGNLLFDQDLWATEPSYLLRLDLRAGRAVYTGVDPVVLDGYLPRPTVGDLAAASGRIAAGTVPSGMRLGGSGAEAGQPEGGTRSTVLTVPAGGTARVPAGWSVEPTRGLRLGEDLLFGTGTFEASDTDPTTTGARLWATGLYAQASDRAACSGAEGVELVRSPVSEKDVYASTDHRTPVQPGDELSLLLGVRHATEGATAEVRWYSAMSGASSSVESIVLPVGTWEPGRCPVVRLDLAAPAGAQAAQVFLRLTPPNDPQAAASLLVDDVSLVRWTAGLAAVRADVVAADGARVDATLTTMEPARR